MPFLLDEVPLRTGDTEQPCIVVTPLEPIVIGRERIERMRHPKATALSKVDRWLVDEVGARAERSAVLLFRAVDADGNEALRFDPELEEEELVDGGVAFTRVLLPLYRRFLARGIVQMIHTDMPGLECHVMRHGVRALGEPEDDAPDALRDLDVWICKNMILHVALGLDHVVGDFLPPHLRMIERRRRQVRELIAGVPTSELE